jgi:hypothetical protein
VIVLHHAYIYVYIYIYISLCVCVCVLYDNFINSCTEWKEWDDTDGLNTFYFDLKYYWQLEGYGTLFHILNSFVIFTEVSTGIWYMKIIPEFCVSEIDKNYFVLSTRNGNTENKYCWPMKILNILEEGCSVMVLCSIEMVLFCI